MSKSRKEIHPKSIGYRFDLVISHFKLNLKTFANSLGYSQGILSEVRSGKKPATSRLIHSICATYGISEHWLRTGEGQMFNAETSTVNESTPYYGENTLAEINALVAGMNQNEQRQILNYIRERLLLADLLAKRKDVNNAPV